jgi:D-sedoheptulose 7-phosphate isomerase
LTKTKDDIISFLKEQESCLAQISEHAGTIEKIVKVLITARNTGKKIYTMGNGGSASTASHFVSDLLKTAITKKNKRFSAISLTDNIPVMLAWANDVSYEDVFLEQMKNFLSRGDVIIGFSGSGKSKNVIKAMLHGKKNGALCIGITGMKGGDFPSVCDICLIVSSNDMLAIESTHVTLCHCIISAIRNLGKPMFTYE